MLKKMLIKTGGSYALVINKTLLEMLKINPDSEVEILTDGKGLFVRQVDDGKVVKGKRKRRKARA